MPARRDPGSPSWSCRAPRDQSESGTLFLSGLVNWPGITHVAELTRTRTEKGKTTVEVVYLISILPSGQPAPQHLLELSRGDFRIENSLHYVRDVTFGEDRSRLRTGHSPQILAACRNLAITLIHRSGSSHIAASRRFFSYHPRRAFDLLLSRASPQQ